MYRFILLLPLLWLTACGLDDDDLLDESIPQIRVVNNSNLFLTDVRLDPSFDTPGPSFGALEIGESSPYRPYPTGDACSFQLTATAEGSGCVTTGARACAVADPLQAGRYTLTLFPEEAVPAQCIFLDADIVRE